MIITYKLEKDLVGRAATQLCWKLGELKSSVKIMTERMINAKSLVGILSAHLHNGQDIVIAFDYDDEANKIKEFFNEIGHETNDTFE